MNHQCSGEVENQNITKVLLTRSIWKLSASGKTAHAWFILFYRSSLWFTEKLGNRVQRSQNLTICMNSHTTDIQSLLYSVNQCRYILTAHFWELHTLWVWRSASNMFTPSYRIASFSQCRWKLIFSTEDLPVLLANFPILLRAPFPPLYALVSTDLFYCLHSFVFPECLMFGILQYTVFLV